MARLKTYENLQDVDQSQDHDSVRVPVNKNTNPAAFVRTLTNLNEHEKNISTRYQEQIREAYAQGFRRILQDSDKHQWKDNFNQPKPDHIFLPLNHYYNKISVELEIQDDDQFFRFLDSKYQSDLYKGVVYVNFNDDTRQMEVDPNDATFIIPKNFRTIDAQAFNESLTQLVSLAFEYKDIEENSEISFAQLQSTQLSDAEREAHLKIFLEAKKLSGDPLSSHELKIILKNNSLDQQAKLLNTLHSFEFKKIEKNYSHVQKEYILALLMSKDMDDHERPLTDALASLDKPIRDDLLADLCDSVYRLNQFKKTKSGSYEGSYRVSNTLERELSSYFKSEFLFDKQRQVKNIFLPTGEETLTPEDILTLSYFLQNKMDVLLAAPGRAQVLPKILQCSKITGAVFDSKDLSTAIKDYVNSTKNAIDKHEYTWGDFANNLQSIFDYI